FRLRANHFFINDQADSCITYYNKAIEQYASNSMANNRRIALVYMNRAMLATTLEAYDESSLFFQKALKWARNNNSLLGDVYLEWANNLSEKALQQPDYPELHQSNQLLRRADSLGCSSRSRMLYQLGANHQNLALYLYDEEPIRYDSLVNLAANYYRQTIQNAIKEKNISILPQVSTTIAQLFEMGSIKEDKAIMSALSEGYLTSYDSLKVVQQKREELLIDQNEQNILQEKQARLRVIYLFTALLILVAFGLLFYSQQQKIKNLKLQFDIKMEALRSQMNSHFISNTLNAIDSLIMEGRKEEASNYIVGFSRLCRNILNSSKKSYISLHDEIEILKGYLKFEKLRLGDRLMIHWDIDASIDLVHQMVPSLILQPFVENAIWHGILNKPDRSPGNLTVAISNQSKEHLVCIIEDDGIGREKAKAIRSEQSIEWQSWGMKITNERIKALQQIKDAKLEIIDLYDEHDKGIGTKVMIYLPKEVKNNT
ncbi:MAG: histidine kinase, partial [Bacteroidota bacterium]